LIEELKKNKIPISHSPFNIITDETTQEILAVAEIILDPTNDLLIAGILKGAYFRWTNEQLENLLINRETTLLQHMANSTDPELVQIVSVIKAWFSLPKDLYGLYSQVLFHSDYGRALWEEFPNETLMFWERVVEERHLSVAEFVSNIKNSSHTIAANINGVNITTIHSAKGQEAEIVFLCNTHTYQAKGSSSNLIMDNLLLLKKNYKLYKIAKHKLLVAQDEELLRLFYVALTRAKEQIYILPPTSTDTINSKSWYAAVIAKLNLFQSVEDFYEIGTKPVGLTKHLKYS
jgi:ATP-dependent exoDNAse (exonuclease V) beta subunit